MRAVEKKHSVIITCPLSSPIFPFPIDTFAISPEDGTITLAKTLDYDSGQVNYTLIIIARNVERNGTAMMFVEVFDVNDHAPEFQSPPGSSYPLTIYEVYAIAMCLKDQHAYP